MTTPNTDALHPEINRRLNALLLEVDSSIVNDIRQALLTYQPFTRTPSPSASVAEHDLREKGE